MRWGSLTYDTDFVHFLVFSCWGYNLPQHMGNLCNNITTAAKSSLGTTKPGRRKIDKQTWFWTDEVQEKVYVRRRQHTRNGLHRRRKITGCNTNKRRREQSKKLQNNGRHTIINWSTKNFFFKRHGVCERF